MPPLIVHVIYYLGVGGMENGLVNLINKMPTGSYRHAIICLTEHTEFANRISRDDVDIYALHMKKGKDLSIYPKLYKLLRKLQPDIIHTRNLAALEAHLPAFLAGVPGRVHGEHGRDVFDLHGVNWKYNLLRKLMRFLVHHYIAVSHDLAAWLRDTVRVPAQRVTQIYNGVDTQKFLPRTTTRIGYGPDTFADDNNIVIGTVGRMAEVKDQLTLARAFVRLVEMLPAQRDHLRLMMIGDGPLKDQVAEILNNADVSQQVWLPGERDDIPQLLQMMDIFVLPSLGEGISNTILEAMSTGLPVVATAVGGNSELVDDGTTGRLVPAGQADQMAQAIRRYIEQPDIRREHGKAGREKVETKFSISSMVEGYRSVYDDLMQARARPG